MRSDLRFPPVCWLLTENSRIRHEHLGRAVTAVCGTHITAACKQSLNPAHADTPYIHRMVVGGGAELHCGYRRMLCVKAISLLLVRESLHMKSYCDCVATNSNYIMPYNEKCTYESLIT